MEVMASMDRQIDRQLSTVPSAHVGKHNKAEN